MTILLFYSAYSESAMKMLTRVKSVQELSAVQCVCVDSRDVKVMLGKLGVISVPSVLVKTDAGAELHSGFELQEWLDRLIDNLRPVDEDVDLGAGRGSSMRFGVVDGDEEEDGGMEEEKPRSAAEEKARSLNNRMAQMMQERNMMEDRGGDLRKDRK